MLKIRRGIVLVMVLACVLALAGPVVAADKEATLATTSGASINDNLLDQYIDSFIPPTANRLLVFTQCYGGDMTKRFAGKSNTAVASATDEGQIAHYGGYDDDAAGALTPGAGTTAADVHNAGTAGKDSRETPTTGGGLALSDFSLAPVVDTATSPVRSRHVVVYAGVPDTSAGRDNALRDKVTNNFAGQPNTTVTTVGGSGTAAGYDEPGSAKGLRDAIKAAGAAIAAAPDPSKEQFILYVTDHGDLHNKQPVTTPVVSGGSTTVENVPSFETPDLDNPLLPSPGFTLELELPDGLLVPVPEFHEYLPLFGPGEWAITLTPLNGPSAGVPFILPDFEEMPLELDNEILGDLTGEVINLEFDIDPDWWVESFFDVLYDVRIDNFSSLDVTVLSFSQSTGPVAKVPEPTMLVLTLLGAVGLLRRRRAA